MTNKKFYNNSQCTLVTQVVRFFNRTEVTSYYRPHSEGMGKVMFSLVPMGVPPPPNQETEQQSEHLLRGGRYASCVHAGELSCCAYKNVYN